MADDLYALLEIDKNASQDDIKKAYRKRAMQYHPDVNKDKDAEEKFKKISQAYEVLSDDDRRAHYDRVGPANFEKSGMGGGMGGMGGGFQGFGFNPQFNSQFSFSSFSTESDLFGRTFSEPRVNPDIKTSCTLTLKQIMRGDKIKVSINRQVACPECDGKGFNKGTTKCKDCGGKGVKSVRLGNMMFDTICSRCHGSGSDRIHCNKCGGKAYSSVREELMVTLPSNIVRMSTLKLQEKGNEVYIRGKKYIGDLYLLVDYSPIQDGVMFDNGDLYLTTIVPFNTVLGEETIEINVFDCKTIKLKLESSKHSGYQYNLMGQGLNNKNAHVKVFIDLPKNNISGEQRQQLTEFMGAIYGNAAKTFKPEQITSFNS